MSKTFILFIVVSISSIFSEANSMNISCCFEENKPSINNSEEICGLFPKFNYKTNGLTVFFIDKSKGLYKEILWDFGDGNSSIEENPMHTYSERGTYKFTQTIISEEGCSKSFLGEVYVK
ncbi:MAG: PKD domain-containing protein [Chitinophagales bacterium]